MQVYLLFLILTLTRNGLVHMKELKMTSDSKQTLEERVKHLEGKENNIGDRVRKLEELTKVSTLRSCSEYAAFDLSTTGFFLIDPDGPLVGQAPIRVLCNFTSGSTEILHDAGGLTQVDYCHDAGKIHLCGATN